MGGIRPNRRLNFVAVFFNAPETKRAVGRSHNIYADVYDRDSGLFRYTGEGQRGDQKLTRGNLWLVNAKKRGTKIHLFKQHSLGGLHEYLGEVEVESYITESQKDVVGKPRTVFIFWLRPISGPVAPESDAIQREVDFELIVRRRSTQSRDQIENELKRVNEIVSKHGPSQRTVSRSAVEFVRFKKIVTLLKLLFDTECQVCGSKNFETSNGVYSEAHHLVPWSISHDDARENLVVVCANCHRKFHHARTTERLEMYKRLCERFPEVNFKVPPYVIKSV